MTSEEFKNFRAAMALKMGLEDDILSDRKTAALLGCSKTMARKWSAHGPPLHVDYACAAIARGLKPWSVKQQERTTK